MTYLTGAFRSHNHPEDKFVDRGPLCAAPVLATAHVWRDIVALADNGNALAKKVVRLGTAMNARKLARAEGSEVPAWAQEILSPIEDEESETENLDEAIAALNAAIQ